MIFAGILVLAVAGGVWFWLSRRPAEKPVEKSVAEPETAAAEQARPQSDQSAGVQQMFARAQNLAGSGKLTEARDMLDEVIQTSADEALRNNALRVQGRIVMQMFLSATPMPEKQSYVIQPGDSLDRIARRNKTTVELIRRMNKIDGNLIYPGTRIQIPSAPFVIQVDKSAKTLDLVMNGRRFKRYAVGLGRYGKTPLGTFHTVVHQTNPDWTPPGGGIIPFGDPRNVLGTRWISILDDGRPEIQGFGIHGTSERDSIGGDTSNGCVRMLNEDVEEVFMLIPRGTEVIISE